jgi:DNA-binding MarR family transcriptional regulator
VSRCALVEGPRISYVISRVERTVRAAINDRVKPYGLTTLQYTTLSILGARDGLSNAQLARRTYVTPQAMSEVIAALETKGLIRRKPHPSHRRIYPATLTARGREVLAICDRTVDELEREMLQDLSPEERASLSAGLMSAARSLNAGFPE